MTTTTLQTEKHIYRDSAISLDLLRNKTVAMIGYGNQGQPQSLNLRDSGIHIIVGARQKENKWGPAGQRAESDKMPLFTIEDAVKQADVVMLMVPDEAMAQTYALIKPYLKSTVYIGFGHGLAIHAKWITPEKNHNVFLLAPKGQGRGVRNKYLLDSGVPGLVAVYQDSSGDTLDVALAYGKAIGCARVGILPTSFEEEMVCDLFTEQVVLCGGLNHLIMAAFDTLVDAGYSRESAYFECLYEVKLVADLMHDRGIAGLREGISSTALFGDVTRGNRIIDGHVKERMRNVLEEIQSGEFAEEMRRDVAHGRDRVNNALVRDAQHGIEKAHEYLHRELNF